MTGRFRICRFQPLERRLALTSVVLSIDHIASDETSWPLQVELADLDGDGDLDLLGYFAIDEFVNNRVAWYDNLDGSGRFGPANLITSEIAPIRWVSPIDIDGDGDLDLVVSASYVGEFSRGSLNWFENVDGKGDFGPPNQISIDETNLRSVGLGVGDVNGDGSAELVVTSTSEVGWIEPLGVDKFSYRRIGAAAGERFLSVDLGDIDSDGDLDVLYSSANSVGIYMNLGQGSFDDVTILDGDRRRFAILSDVTGDNRLDVMVGKDDGIDIYRSRFDGTYSIDRLTDDEGHALTAADIDNDGDNDLLLARSTGIVLYENLATGLFAAGISLALAPDDTRDQFLLDISAGDVDADGRIDMVAGWGQSRVQNRADIFWYRNRLIGDSNSDGVFDTEDLVFVFQAGEFEDGVPGNSNFDQGDWDGDGDFDSADLVFAFQAGTYVDR